MTWLEEYSNQAGLSDQLKDRPNHVFLLSSGLFGEAGSVLAELKKQQREREAYPLYRHRVLEELGDFLWYFVRLAETCDAGALSQLRSPEPGEGSGRDVAPELAMEFASAVGGVIECVRQKDATKLRPAFARLWAMYTAIISDLGIAIKDITGYNIEKIQSRWPVVCEYHRLFDDECLSEDQLPRKLEVEFVERSKPGSDKAQVLLRYRGVNIGDRLTDNISEPDAYRYHDIFHMAYAVFLGWSPVTRSLLRCKRKGDPDADEDQDGARAGIVEEAVSAIVFSRAKNMKYFAGASQIDYDLLKSIQEFTKGFEVEGVPMWQWERAILEGFRIFRHLRDDGPGGLVSWDMLSRHLSWSPPH